MGGNVVGSQATSSDAEQLYRRRSVQFAEEAARWGRHGRKLAVARGASFLAGAGLLAWAYFDPAVRLAGTVAGALSLLVMLGLAVLDDSLQRLAIHRDHQRRINDWLLARRRRQWQSIPVPQVDVPSHHAATAKDLDVFGRASLFQWVNLAHTPAGLRMLRDWLLEQAAPDEIAARQAAVRALTPDFELREELTLRGHWLAASLAGPDAFVRWAEGQPFLGRRPLLTWVTRVLTLAVLATVLALILGACSANLGGMLILLLILLNLLVSVLFTGHVHDIFNSISSRHREMRHYLALFELIGRVPDDTPRLQSLRRRAITAEHGALHQLNRLRLVIMLANLRHDSLLSILYVFLQATVLWDFHVLFLLERWQRRCAGQVRQWFEALAELESLSSLAGIAFDHPDWCFPEIETGGDPCFRAEGLGHPLLPDTTRVVNDVQVGPPGTVLLVTGSNMSGKSTLLRSIGLNVLLAEAGGPVCAQSLVMAPVTVTTSMRVQDSLEDGVSFFMAELRRLKSIVDQAVDYARRDDRTLLYLLDEILQGTNSVERHVAVARVLAHLVARQSIGAVSTHDLALAQSPELAAACNCVHFRETLHDAASRRQMTFDYRLRPGVATTTNALKLLELVGLLDPEDGRDAGANQR